MHYSLVYQNPNLHFLKILIDTPQLSLGKYWLQLPAWRPGRYELGNFAKNIREVSIKNKSGALVPFRKINKDRWEFEVDSTSEMVISYKYYAEDLNAGSTLVNEDQLYVNPVNCLMYLVGYENEPCHVKLIIPDNFKVATGLNMLNKTEFVAVDMQTLMDSPIIASDTIQHFSYSIGETIFNCWFQGVINVDWHRMKMDFERFSMYQFEKFGNFPFDTYHFLFQISTQDAYHGVEHLNSTVILLGPSYSIFGNKYIDLLGVSSHELYHAWNIKAIRPEEMMPYDFSRENYSRLGYVAEGVTTYMGDRILYESGTISTDQYKTELCLQLKKHFHNYGRKYYAVADSSFDTWLDGYVQGVPGRKVSIYTEGAWIAYICDQRIRRNSHFTLHDVMRALYEATKHSGYTENMYRQILEEISGVSFVDIFDNLVNGTEDYYAYIDQALCSDGWKLIRRESNEICLQRGIKLSTKGKVMDVYEDSTAWINCIVRNDIILSVNGIKTANDLNQWFNYFGDISLNLDVERDGKIVKIILGPKNQNQFYDFDLQALPGKDN